MISKKEAVEEKHGFANMTGFDLFQLITSAHGGKNMYFKQQDGMIYSRWSHDYMTEDKALEEFLNMIGDYGDL